VDVVEHKPDSGFSVQGLGFGVSGLKVQVSGFRFQGVGCGD